ncbi:MAG: carbon-nitrogen hydrolase family protein [Hyphomonadaceae bacterium]
MKVTVCQIDPRPSEVEAFVVQLAEHMHAEQSEFLLLPEMGFSNWLASEKPGPDADTLWAEAVASHEHHIAKLGALGAKAVIGARPILTETGQRRNEAYLWTQDTPAPTGFHQKYYLPEEDEYYEASWYQRGEKRFDTVDALGAKFGVQICTELWFFEWSRHYGRLGAEVLCVPRATPHGNVDKWISGGQAAAVCSGAYCLSSNLWAPANSGANLGGGGWIIDPDGGLLARTDEDTPFASAEIDLDLARASKNTYPRYVDE